MNLNLFGMGLWNKTEEKLKKKRGGMMIVEKHFSITVMTLLSLCVSHRKNY